MSEHSKTYRCQLEVRGYELDSFGHVNNAVYLQYLEQARWKMLAEEDITLPKLNEWKRWPVIARVEINYLKPLFLGDVIEVQTRIIGPSKRASFDIEQKIFKDTALVSAAVLRAVVVDENGRPVGLPEKFLQLTEGLK